MAVPTGGCCVAKPFCVDSSPRSRNARGQRQAPLIAQAHRVHDETWTAYAPDLDASEQALTFVSPCESSVHGL
jgi:hypothetical protein